MGNSPPYGICILQRRGWTLRKLPQGRVTVTEPNLSTPQLPPYSRSNWGPSPASPDSERWGVGTLGVWSSGSECRPSPARAWGPEKLGAAASPSLRELEGLTRREGPGGAGSAIVRPPSAAARKEEGAGDARTEKDLKSEKFAHSFISGRAEAGSAKVSLPLFGEQRATRKEPCLEPRLQSWALNLFHKGGLRVWKLEGGQGVLKTNSVFSHI